MDNPSEIPRESAERLAATSFVGQWLESVIVGSNSAQTASDLIQSIPQNTEGLLEHVVTALVSDPQVGFKSYITSTAGRACANEFETLFRIAGPDSHHWHSVVRQSERLARLREQEGKRLEALALHGLTKLGQCFAGERQWCAAVITCAVDAFSARIASIGGSCSTEASYERVAHLLLQVFSQHGSQPPTEG